MKPINLKLGTLYDILRIIYHGDYDLGNNKRKRESTDAFLQLRKYLAKNQINQDNIELQIKIKKIGLGVIRR